MGRIRLAALGISTDRNRDYLLIDNRTGSIRDFRERFGHGHDCSGRGEFDVIHNKLGGGFTAFSGTKPNRRRLSKMARREGCLRPKGTSKEEAFYLPILFRNARSILIILPFDLSIDRVDIAVHEDQECTQETQASHLQ
jgi:hypothetical protein